MSVCVCVCDLECVEGDREVAMRFTLRTLPCSLFRITPIPDSLLQRAVTQQGTHAALDPMQQVGWLSRVYKFVCDTNDMSLQYGTRDCFYNG